MDMAPSEGKDAVAEGGPQARIFISYSRRDMAFADRLEAALKSRAFEVLIDRAEICAFEDWWKHVGRISRRRNPPYALSDERAKSVL